MGTHFMDSATDDSRYSIRYSFKETIQPGAVMHSVTISLHKEIFRSFRPLISLYTVFFLLIIIFTKSAHCGQSAIEPPVFRDVSVHDPSVLRVNDTFWVIGSHLASAYSTDLIKWTQYTNDGVRNGNKLIPNVTEELSETFAWSKVTGLWAGCFAQIDNGKFYMYYCSCEGSSPLSALGIAVSNNIGGPYTNLKILLRSGMNGTGEDGTRYNANVHPNAIDPHTFFDAQHTLWMVYGSYSGGIYIIKMDPSTGYQLPNQGYGKKLMGGNHGQLEGAFIQYSPHTKYYYLFISFGGLGANDGYNLRVARSKNPDGPYLDPMGNDMINCKATGGDTRGSLAPYGHKLAGNFQFMDENGKATGIGYASPGHNSTIYDSVSNRYFNIMHTRFPGRGEFHQVRVHQMFINEDEWFVMAPHRYAGENAVFINAESIPGTYAFVDHGRDISGTVKNSQKVTLSRDGTISGAVTGSWEKRGDYLMRMTIGGTVYNGVALRQWDSGLEREVMALSAMSVSKGNSIWMSRLDAEVKLKNTASLEHCMAPYLIIRNEKASFFLEHAGDARIIAYDHSGRKAGILWSGRGIAGQNIVTLNKASLVPGAYFFTLRHGNSSVTRHIVFSAK